MQTGNIDNVQPGANDDNKNSQPGQKLNSDIKPMDSTSSPDCIKPNVVCSSSGLPSGGSANGVAVHMICHPERPYSEYLLVPPEDYVEGLTYSDYIKIYKPIVVAELEKVSNVQTS